MNAGVEWGLHSCLNLAWVGPEYAVSSTRLAEYYALPTAYMNKQLQALAKAGIVYSTPGPGGGFRLARACVDITLMDVVAAIEGRDPAFRCAEIRQRGPGAVEDESPDLCLVDQAMRRAELAWRAELADQTLADLKGAVERRFPDVPLRARRWFVTP